MKKSFYALFLGFFALFAFSCNNPLNYNKDVKKTSESVTDSTKGLVKLSIGGKSSARMIGSEFSDFSDVTEWTVTYENVETGKSVSDIMKSDSSEYSYELPVGCYNIYVESESETVKFSGTVYEVEIIPATEKPEGVNVVVPVSPVLEGRGSFWAEYFCGYLGPYRFTVVLKNMSTNEEIDLSDSVLNVSDYIQFGGENIPAGYYEILITSNYYGPLVLSESYALIVAGETSRYEGGFMRQYVYKTYYATVKESKMNGSSPAAPINMDALIEKLRATDTWDSVEIYCPEISPENFDLKKLQVVDTPRTEGFNKSFTIYADNFGDKLYAKYENGGFVYSADTSVFENAYDVVYVSWNGRSEAYYPGSDMKSPLRSIELAVPQVAPGGKIVLLSDVYVDEGIIATKDFTITIPEDRKENVTINCVKTDSMEKRVGEENVLVSGQCIFVYESVLTVEGNENADIVIKGSEYTSSSNALIYCRGSDDNRDNPIATLKMENVTIDGSYGTAIGMYQSNVELNKVLIGNKDVVFPESPAETLDAARGKFSCVAYTGAAIHAQWCNKVTLTDTEITGNWSEKGAVYLDGASISFTMNGGSITNNYSSKKGGGICVGDYVSEYEINLYDVDIHGNYASEGSAIYTPAKAKLHIGGLMQLGSSAHEDRVYLGTGFNNHPGNNITIDKELDPASEIFVSASYGNERLDPTVQISEELAGSWTLEECYECFDFVDPESSNQVLYLNKTDGMLSKEKPNN